MSTLTVVKAGSRRGRKRIERLIARGEAARDDKVRFRVAKIVERVRRRGDAGVLWAARKHDGTTAAAVAELRYDARQAPLPSELPGGFAEAFERAIAAVERYHRPLVREGRSVEEGGLSLEERLVPLRRIGIYIPGGRASYPSTLVMTVVPARLAAVERIAVVTPPGALAASAPLRYALHRLAVDEVWALGGAQAIAALAWGTETIERVDKIVGPGNTWVTEAKRQLVGVVGIDGLAGPTEVVVLASGDADPELVAADLLAQAEHDPQAAAVLVTPDKSLARAVAAAVDEQLAELPAAGPAKEALRGFGAAFVVADLDEAVALVDAIAPEHLQLVGEAAEALADHPFVAGGLFVGPSSPEVFGDYVLGPSHVLPTGGSARWASALGIDDFVRRSHVVRCDGAAAAKLAEPAATLAEAEGLPAHAAAARRRRQ